MDLAISLAGTTPVYSTETIQKAAVDLGPDAPPGLLRLYGKMMNSGGERFIVKPSRVPDFDSLKRDLPNFGEVLTEVRKSIALCVDTSDPLEIPPMCLKGLPGIGKTFFARSLSRILCTEYHFIPMNTQTAGWVLTGAGRSWKDSRPGKVFDALVKGKFANPVIVLDEIEKSGGAGASDPLGALYTLLEGDTAKEFVDDYADVPINAGHVIWVATANDLGPIPDAIQKRLRIFDVPPPTPDEARWIVAALYREDIHSHQWGKDYPDTPSDDIIDILVGIPQREIKQALQSAFGSAKLASRNELRPEDFPAKRAGKSRIGF